MGKRGSGATHVRYGHVTRPTALALACPRCAALVHAVQPVHATRWSIGDCSPEWSERWSLVCTGCTYRAKGLTWEEMRQVSPLFFRVDVAGVELWAWNEDHLGLLVHVLEGGDPSRSPLGYFATYFKKEWLRRSRRETFAKAARRMLDAIRSPA